MMNFMNAKDILRKNISILLQIGSKIKRHLFKFLSVQASFLKAIT